MEYTNDNIYMYTVETCFTSTDETVGIVT